MININSYALRSPPSPGGPAKTEVRDDRREGEKQFFINQSTPKAMITRMAPDLRVSLSPGFGSWEVHVQFVTLPGCNEDITDRTWPRHLYIRGARSRPAPPQPRLVTRLQAQGVRDPGVVVNQTVQDRLRCNDLVGPGLKRR